MKDCSKVVVKFNWPVQSVKKYFCITCLGGCMSGSGGGDFSSTGNSRVGGGISASDVNQDSCYSFRFDTTIGSPRINIVNALSENDSLKVSLQVDGGVETIILKTQGDDLVGGLSPSQEVEFIKMCINLYSTEYVAQVLSISGSLVRITVSSV